MASWFVHSASGSNGSAVCPGWGHCIVFLGKTLLTLRLTLSTRTYKWLLANLMLGGNVAMIYHPNQGE